MMLKELSDHWKRSIRLKTATFFILWRVVLVVVLLGVIVPLIPFNERFDSQIFGRGSPYWIKVWANFDGFQYLRIARDGYNTENLPFFPFYPLTVRVVHELTNIRYLYSGLIVSYLAFVGCLAIFYQLLKKDGEESHWMKFIGILFIYPTAFFYGAAYNDSLFLLYSLLCVYFSRQRNWVFASVAGIFATATRLNGLALGIYVGVEFISSLYESNWDTWQVPTYFKHLFSKKTWIAVWLSGAWTVFFIPLTYFTFLYYIQEGFGDWKMIHQAMSVWGQDKVVFPPIIFYRYLKIFLTVDIFSVLYLVAFLEFFSVLFYIFISLYSWRKIRFSYWSLMTVSFIIPSLTGTFAGMPRYALHLYPFFLVLLLLWKRLSKPWRVVFVCICVVLQITILSLFSRGYFVT